MPYQSNNDLNLKIGERITEIRKNYITHNGKIASQEYFSELLDTNPKTLSRIETGVQAISISVLITLSKISEKSIDYILTGKDTDSNKVQKVNEKLSEKLDRLCQEHDELNKKLIKFCVEITCNEEVS